MLWLHRSEAQRGPRPASMPLLRRQAGTEEVELYYELHGEDRCVESAARSSGPPLWWVCSVLPLNPEQSPGDLFRLAVQCPEHHR